MADPSNRRISYVHMGRDDERAPEDVKIVKLHPSATAISDYAFKNTYLYHIERKIITLSSNFQNERKDFMFHVTYFRKIEFLWPGVLYLQ